MKLLGSLTELVNLIFRKDGKQVTLKPNQSTTYSADRQVELPPKDGDDVLVSESATQSLSNKTIDGDSNTIQDVGISSLKTVAGDANKALVRDGSGVVTSAKITNDNVDASAGIVYSKLNIQDGDLSIAKTSGLQTALDGKVDENSPIVGATKTKITFDSKGLVTSGADLAAGDLPTGIDAAKIGSGSVDNTEFGYLNGVTSSIQTQLGNKADSSTLSAHTGASTAHGTTSALVGISDAQILTNKDIDGGTAANSRRITLPKDTKSNLDGLTRKQATLVYGSDTNKVYADDGVNLKEIGSGSSGINYLSSHFGADALGTVETSVGDTLSSSTRSSPNQWGNSAATALITQSTDSTLRGTTNYLIQFSANSQFVESPLFSLDGEDLGKPLLVQFDVSGVSTADDVQVYMVRYNSSNVLQERILVAGTASATSPKSAQVPTGVTTFKGFFVPGSTSTDKYALRVARNANNTSMRLDSFVVGPQSVAQGAVITRWQDFVPTISNFGTVTNLIAKYARVGNTIFVKGSCTAGTTAASAFSISLPSGLSFDTTLGAGKQAVGRLDVLKSAAGPNTNAFSDYQALFLDTSTSASVVYAAYQNGSGAYVKNTGSGITSSGNSINFEFNAPIAEWATGTTTLADRAVEEYAFNTSTGAGTDLTAFANGPQGQAFGQNYANRTLRVRFQTPILPTDQIITEWQESNGTPWFPMIQDSLVLDVSRFTYQQPTRYGMGVVRRVAGSNTDVDVEFGAYGRPGATYAGAGTSWTSVPATAKWRVRKVSGGAAVGYPIAPANITLLDNTENYSGNTKLGLMQYLVGTAYNGGVTPSISLIAGGGTLTSTIRGTLIPYQMADGAWRLKFDIVVLLSTTTRTQAIIAISGVTTKNVANFAQPIVANQNDSANISIYRTNTGINNGNLVCEHASATTGLYQYGGDIELNSKPTWAY